MPDSSLFNSLAKPAWRAALLSALLGVAGPLVAAEPGPDEATSAQDKANHWAFKPVGRPAPPSVKMSGWARNPIDLFILARLEKENLSPSPEADRVTLIRRLYLDLTGLPPAPEEVDAFVKDESPGAWAQCVDRLLDSPRYGECWARHWLDVVRFAESNGFETNTPRRNAWPYRDYVIRAFNEDKPWRQFILEQLAGDAFGADEATGFIVGGPWDEVKSPDINLTAQQRMDELHDMVATTGSAFLGLTVGCARCHNHKFDPISQADYYSMQAVFAGVQHGDRSLSTPDAAQKMAEAERLKLRLKEINRELDEYEDAADLPASPGAGPAQGNAILRPAVNPRRNTEKLQALSAKHLRFVILETNGAEPCLDELEVWTAEPKPRNAALSAKPSASGVYPNSEIHRLEHINDGLVGNSHSWISNEPGKGWVRLDFPETIRIGRIVWGRDREERFADRLATNYRIEVSEDGQTWKEAAGSSDRLPFVPGGKANPVAVLASASPAEAAKMEALQAERKKIETAVRELSAAPMVYAGRFEKQPGPSYLLYRGEALQRREQVAPGGLKKFGAKLELPVTATDQERRLALARWIVDEQNPLTARVLVNRIWQYHFGQGLAGTPSDFGRNGAAPTHPELLDWLASEFMAGGWRVKSLHRLILLSSAWRQSSRPNREALAADAGCALLWRFPPRRLEAEPLRDSILAVSGNLQLKMGGPGFDLFEPNDNYVRVFNSRQDFGPSEWRRMIYLTKHRMQLDDVFGSFDCPDAGQIAPKRNSSITALQALNLLNSSFITQQSRIFSERLKREAGPKPGPQIARAFRLIFSRSPAPMEAEAAAKLIQEHGLEAFCRGLFNANEFVFLF